MNRLLLFLLMLPLLVGSVSAQSLSEQQVCEVMNHAMALSKEKKHAEALEQYLIVGKNTAQKRTALENQVYVTSQIQAALCCQLTKKHLLGYQLTKDLLTCNLTEKERKEANRLYVMNGYMVATNLLLNNKKILTDCQKARTILLELVPYADDQLRSYILTKIPMTWYKEGIQHFSILSFHKALACFENAQKGYHKQQLSQNEIVVLTAIGMAKDALYDLDGAIESYEQALTLARQVGDEVSQISIATDLYKLYNSIGDMVSATKKMHLIDSIGETTTNAQTQFDYFFQKGEEAQLQGDLSLAEHWMLKAEQTMETQHLRNGRKNNIKLYGQLRKIYTNKKEYDNALRYLQMSIDDSKKANVYSVTSKRTHYLSAADIYSRIGDRNNCMRCIDSLFQTNTSQDSSVESNEAYIIRANCLDKLGDKKAALTDYKKADELLSKSFPVLSGRRSMLYPLIGGLEHQLNHHEEAEHYYRLYAESMKQIYGEKSVDYVNSQIFLANAEGFAGHLKQGCDRYSSAVEHMKDIAKSRLPYMNTAERETFWHPMSKFLTNMTPYAVKAKLYQTDYTRSCYDALLMSKAFLLDTERSLYEIIRSEGTDDDMRQFMVIMSKYNKIKKWERNYSEYADSILTTSNEINQLERALTQKCQAFDDISSFMDVDYERVKSALKKNEYLIDFTNYGKDPHNNTYAAYIVDRAEKYPLLKLLFNESKIDSLGIVRPDMFYDRDYAIDFINLLWQPIENHVTEGSTIYYVPTQLLFQVSLESLPLKDGTLLGDHYHFVRLSSARELVKRKHSNLTDFKSTSAVLYGGLQYDLAPELMAKNAKKYNLNSLYVTRGGTSRGDSVFHELPGTKIEINKISEILSNKEVKVTSYSGTEGTEESFLNMHGRAPQILHLATHGFYYHPEAAAKVNYLKGYTDAMSLSGLILSGGNAAWRGREMPKGVLGGVLTANHISYLDLSKTDMVVLSACQTGQGRATPEGLYGLQRAFKKAGVKTIVMSLWNVSDHVTTDFMVSFYENLVLNQWDKRKAFEEAKRDIRTKYPDPYFWAAFIMLD